MDDAATRLTQALDLLAEVGDAVQPHDAVTELDDATLQLFWREWPRASSWAGTLWRLLEADMAPAARPVGDEDFDELGGSG